VPNVQHVFFFDMNKTMVIEVKHGYDRKAWLLRLERLSLQIEEIRSWLHRMQIPSIFSLVEPAHGDTSTVFIIRKERNKYKVQFY
jgi:hypothetical protein